MSEAIKNLSQQWADLYNRGDIAGVANLYTDDAVIYANTGEVVSGREAIQQAFGKAYDAAPGEATREASDEVETLGDVAYNIGRYTLTNVDGRTISRGNYLTLLKKIEGDWKIYRQIDNLDMSLQGKE